MGKNWCDPTEIFEDTTSRQDDQIDDQTDNHTEARKDDLTEEHTSDPTEDYTEHQTDYSIESDDKEATEDDSISKTIIYVLSFIVVLFFIIAIIGLVIYFKKFRIKSKSVEGQNWRRNRGIELELSSHHYDSVHDYDYAEAPQPDPLQPIPENIPRSQYDHLEFSRTVEPNSPVLSHYDNLHSRNFGESSRQIQDEEE